jgi:hypothetical protein
MQRKPARPYHGIHIDVGAFVDEQLRRHFLPVL